MNFQLVKLKNFCGSKASIYTLKDVDADTTLFEKFISENINSFKSEIIDITKRLNTIGKVTGARVEFVKTKEGKPGDLVCALYDKPNSKLRLYCIRLGSSLIIIGGGGHKPKSIKALQEDPKLKQENKIMVDLSKELLNRLQNKELKYTNDYKDLEGNLEFEI